jgi:uncharacterized protein YbjT (DUF2867 family)
MKVLILGATGLSGSMVLEGLLAADQVSQVVAPVRRALSLEHEKLAQAVVDFDCLDAHESLFAVDVIVCCLGSTIKKAGSRERFRSIDYGIAIKAAEIGRKQGADAFILMSAVGASASSPVFYNRVKGELEDGLKALAFPYLSIYQPGLLMSERSEQRLAETMGIKAMPAINCLLQGPMKRYRGIEAETVARAMVNEIVNLSERDPPNVSEIHIRQHDDMMALAG